MVCLKISKSDGQPLCVNSTPFEAATSEDAFSATRLAADPSEQRALSIDNYSHNRVLLGISSDSAAEFVA